MKSFLSHVMRKAIVFVGVRLQYGENAIASRTLPRFANQPKNLRFDRPRKIYNPQHIYLGDDVIIGSGSTLKTVTQYPEKEARARSTGAEIQRFEPKLVIGDRVTATGALQIAALDSITIDDDVMFATNVFLSDGLYGYQNVDLPFRDQRRVDVAPIHVGRGCWIGQNVVVMPGVTIGEMTIVGANSVVTRSIPARSIAVGAPARVIKRWSAKEATWVPSQKQQPV